MTANDVTGWLSAPATLPDSATIDAALRTWPWFVPARMMEAAREHGQSPFSGKTLSTLQLYSSDWLPAYTLLLEEEPEFSFEEEDFEQEAAIGAKDEAAGPVVEEDTNEHPEMSVSDKPEINDDAPLIQPLYAEDYFRHQGINVPEKEEAPQAKAETPPAGTQTLMVVMSFAEWLTHFKTKSQQEQEEAQEKRALRSMWQQEKLAAAMEEEPDEIPEEVFEMAVSSITKEDTIISEPLAQIYERQEKWAAAADMYTKLARKYPAKSSYFASRAEAAKKRQL